MTGWIDQGTDRDGHRVTDSGRRRDGKRQRTATGATGTTPRSNVTATADSSDRAVVRSAMIDAPTRSDAMTGSDEGLGRRTARGVPGVVLRSYGLWYDVQLSGEPRVLLATIKGSLKRFRLRTDPVAVGDQVSVIDVGENEGQIEWRAPRTGVLSRPTRSAEAIEQVILANGDQVIFFFSLRFPEPHLRMLDRFLVLAEAQHLPPRIAINKLDLAAADPGPDGQPIGLDGARALAEEMFRDYRNVYPLHFLSVADGYGVEELRAALTGKVTAIAGPSGVGKSSLLNAIDPTGERLIGAVSAANRKGRHTTIGTQLYRIAPRTFVADTPGMRSLAMSAVPGEQLPECYPEFRPFLGQCYYDDCEHLDEPDCAVIAATGRGEIGRERYESYAALRREANETR